MMFYEMDLHIYDFKSEFWRNAGIEGCGTMQKIALKSQWQLLE